MAWADSGSEVFVISQIGYTRGIIATMRERLGPQALADEDKMLLDAQVEPGPQGRRPRPRSSFMSGGVGGLMNFGKQQAVSNATTAVAYNIDKTFQHARARRACRSTSTARRGPATWRAARTYKPRDRDASLRFKRAAGTRATR